MNRYLLAALYVMAGCAVTIPLKAQHSGESLKVERCRLVITNTVKVISVYVEENDREPFFCNSLSPDYYHFPKFEIHSLRFVFIPQVSMVPGPLCRTSHKIRAPEVYNS